MPAQRRVGMDHEHHDWSPLSKRGVLCWPEQARVAVGVLMLPTPVTMALKWLQGK
jgi:hypothetical protein